ncbi:sterol desaturase family protein [Sphingomonas jatrophae]|uniref:Sterol desaturase/sphingolipid hydroxylase, fatty acid hydroxylase superfamily n=1 Tax=Sphingomonas jatrophae TaxID=1166337 RepID=A0A1I6JV53_9SPHN|nr:sterol desaturase family protein [Sphingomonas jatrophae]SFR82874.1 Sterol desaturase/sphingolipid hydroxylase, fatty acid hydroxylase superfamily [Sphingomonas jatrophae]
MGEWANILAAGLANQIGGTFLQPGSSLFLPALLVTLAISLPLAVPRTTRLPRIAVLRRVLVPRRLWRSRSGQVDIGFFLFSLCGGGVTFGWALISSEMVRSWLRPLLAGSIPALAAGVPPGVVVIAATALTFIAYDAAYWLDHRLKHRVPVLWAFHKVHHSAESLSLLTNFRVHPVDTLVFYNLVALATGVAGAVCDVLAGHPVEPLGIGGTGALVLISAALLTHLQHSHLWVTLGPRWGGWLLGPAHHQVHHSADPRHFDRNFGNVLALWDRLGGSFHRPAERREVPRFGLDDPAAQTLPSLTVRPFTDAARTLIPQAPFAPALSLGNEPG